MFASLTISSLASVRVVREFIAHHERLLAEYDAPTRQEMKAYSVSSSATRLYAIYERFVETLVSDFLDAIPEYCSFAALTDAMRSEYRIGISHLLNRLDSPRYRHLNHENLIRWYHEALSTVTPYRFVPEALTRHDENLRLSVLNGMLCRVQATDLQGWLSHHSSIAALYPDQTSLWEQVESELRNFIQLRNDAAHGTLSELAGPDTLLRYCDLITALIESLSAYLYRQIVVGREAAGKAILLGRVDEIFAVHSASIVPLQPGRSLTVGQRIHVVGQWSCIEAIVTSMHIDNESAIAFTALGEVVEVGVVCSTTPRRGVLIYSDT